MPTPHRPAALLGALLLAACPGKTASTTAELETTGSTSATTGPTTGGSTGDVLQGCNLACEPGGETGGTGGGDVMCADVPEFAASLAAWQSAVAANGPCYHYVITESTEDPVEGTPGCWYTTTVFVSGGVVVERRFTTSTDDPSCEPQFVECGAEVGTQPSDIAAPPLTVDALYAACCAEVLHIEPADNYTVTFDVDAQGWMRACYHVLNGCADGCDGGPGGRSLVFETLAFGPPPPL